MFQKLIIPTFHSETEEAEWWFENREQVDDEIDLAAREGRLRIRVNGISRPLPARLELQGEELEHARIVAERRGLSLEELVKSLVEQAYQAQQAGQLQFQQAQAEETQAA